MLIDEIRQQLYDQLGFRFELQAASIEVASEANHPCYSADADQEITALNLSNLSLVDLPPAIWQLGRLQVLRLYGNRISSLPDSFANLQSLRSLYLPRNRLTELPTPVLKIPGLEVLAVNQNSLTDLPHGIAALTRLRTLGLSGNRFSILPNTIAELANLRSLFLIRNQLQSIPDWLPTLSNLEELSLAGNPLVDVPPLLAQCKKLRVLSLRETRLRSFPLCVIDIEGLSSLDLKGVAIDNIPDEIDRLRRLTELNLSGTRLRDLPPSLSDLRDLTSIDLSSLRLTELSADLFNLTKLQYLYLGSTQARSLPFEIGRLVNLEWLDASGMGLLSVPAVLFRLPRLRHVNLVGNRLKELPAQVLEAPIPLRWRSAPGEPGIFVNRNPLSSPPPEIVGKGEPALRAYFRSLRTHTKPIEEVKVLLVGDGGAGKTSLVKCITGRPFDEDEAQTRGIDIADFHINARGRPIKVHFWDFGGQEIMHATHQFFLSKRSLYLLVLDGRKDEKAEYWLKHIRAFGGDSPILVVLNKIDEQSSFDVNRRFLSEKYPSIAGFHRLSCRTGEGLDGLLAGVSGALAHMEHTRTLWAGSWFAVKERLEATTEDYISYTQFRKICASEGLNDPAEHDVLVDFLHDLGVVLRFTELPLRDTNVINPRWLTQAVYRIINSDRVAAVAGLLKLEWLGSILDHRFYPAEKHHFLIEMMKKFELCYQVDSDTVLLPSLLPVEEPRVTYDLSSVVRFYIDYDVFFKSIMPRFIVKMHRDIDGELRWRTGVVLRSGGFQSRAIVKADEVERRIDIVVEGPQRREYLGVILHAFRAINESYEKLGFKETVPMPDRTDVTISYEHLLRLESKGIRSYMPDGAEKEYDVQELLGRVKPERRSEDEILALLHQLRDKEDTQQSLLEKANSSLMLQPNFFGLGVNLNELIRRVFQRD